MAAAGTDLLYCFTVCVTFGSMAVVGNTDLVTTSVKAALATGHRVVLIAGWASVPADLPADQVLVVRELPHEWLFPRCAAVVYHGGAGTVARVVQAGVPSVIVPVLRFFDQPGWGRAVMICTAELRAVIVAPLSVCTCLARTHTHIGC